MKLKAATAGISASAILLLAACKGNTAATEEPAVPPKTSVTVINPVVSGFADYIQLNGNTQFQKKTVVRANTTGYITDMRWKQGDRISNATVFCNIKTKEQDALKNIDAREPSLRQFQTPISVFTSSSGIITSVNYTKGDFVSEGDVLATITDPASLVLVINVPYEYHGAVRKGKECTVTFPDGKVIAATIQDEVPFVDSASQTQNFLIRFPGNSLLPENMNLIVRIPVKESTQAIALPLDAIQTDETQEEFWVMKLVNDSLAVKVPVTVGLQHDSLREVLTGISINDKVILKGAYGMSDSAAVSISK
jgi:multidrug efflux pump subunit AcrA (membrane-fusion protein)